MLLLLLIGWHSQPWDAAWFADACTRAGTRPKVHAGFYRAWTEKQLDQEIMGVLEVRMMQRLDVNALVSAAQRHPA